MSLRLKSEPGFSLIEMLIVISIVVILALIIITTVSYGIKKGRDAQRVSDIRQVNIALQEYFNRHGQYPPGETWPNSFDSPSNWIPELIAEGIVSTLPNDPINNGKYPFSTGYYSYLYHSDSTNQYRDYNLLAQFEDVGNKNRCELKCWAWHAPASLADQPWCGATSDICSGGWGYSPYLYSDH